MFWVWWYGILNFSLMTTETFIESQNYSSGTSLFVLCLTKHLQEYVTWTTTASIMVGGKRPVSVRNQQQPTACWQAGDEATSRLYTINSLTLLYFLPNILLDAYRISLLRSILWNSFLRRFIYLLIWREFPRHTQEYYKIATDITEGRNWTETVGTNVHPQAAGRPSHTRLH